MYKYMMYFECMAYYFSRLTSNKSLGTSEGGGGGGGGGGQGYAMD